MVFDAVKDILVAQLDLDEASVSGSSNIAEDLGADSLDVVELLMAIEDEFGLEIPDDEIENIKTVDDLVKYIESNE